MAFRFSDLPEELQALIFELAADSDPRSAPNLSLVSRSAATWVQPRIFHTIVIEPLAGTSMESIQLKSPVFLSLHVKRLCITYDSIYMDEASAILSICTSIFDLAFWLGWPPESSHIRNSSPIVDKSSIARVLSELPLLRRVDLPYEQLVAIQRTGSLPRWSTSLTRLEVLYWRVSSEDKHIDIPLLQHLTSLTHLCIEWQMYVLDLHERVDVASFLETRPSLQVVLIDTREEQIPEGHTPFDIRIVYKTEAGDPVEEWLDQGPQAGKWALAEEEVERRRLKRQGRREAKCDNKVSELAVAMQNVRVMGSNYSMGDRTCRYSACNCLADKLAQQHPLEEGERAASTIEQQGCDRVADSWIVVTKENERGGPIEVGQGDSCVWFGTLTSGSFKQSPGLDAVPLSIVCERQGWGVEKVEADSEPLLCDPNRPNCKKA